MDSLGNAFDVCTCIGAGTLGVCYGTAGQMAWCLGCSIPALVVFQHLVGRCFLETREEDSQLLLNCFTAVVIGPCLWYCGLKLHRYSTEQAMQLGLFKIPMPMWV